MFKLQRSYKFTRTIIVQVPLPGDAARSETFVARFRVVPRSEIESASPANGGIPGQILATALVGWQGIEDAEGGPFPFTAENRDKLLEFPFVCDSLMNSYLAAIYGAEPRAPGKPSGRHSRPIN